ncbi:MAG: hypothetical protein HWN66_00935 [Candidatus Helarchaeota archaeon]|nr:hypothetical protein [Candidatus Helarchaeota archaeon]
MASSKSRFEVLKEFKIPPIRNELHDIKAGILKHDFESLRFIAQNQILSHYKKLKTHPKMRDVHVKYINLIILDEFLFRNLNINKLFTKKGVCL